MVNVKTVRTLLIGDAVIARGECAILMIDSDSRILEVSKAFCALGDWSRDALMGSSLEDHIPKGVNHPHSEPIDWIADKYSGGEVPGVTRVPMRCGRREKAVLLNINLMVAEHSFTERPEYLGFVTSHEHLPLSEFLEAENGV